ncbi:MAG TPA: hypothetical protein VHQ01_06615 [Pyrinomonadaceae bacterium]|jgi:hypothetical protein|nr:hypothetical protein [Pyrinomonadaceae bacterium]
MKSIFFVVLFALCFSVAVIAQPRPVEKSAKSEVKAPPAPASFEAKYEGGMIGYSGKIEGFLKFDDANQRLIFLGKDEKEIFGIPYDALLALYPQSQSVTTTTGNVISHIPIAGAGLGGFIKEKRRYMIIQYDDPDVNVRGTANFRIENKELLDSAIQTLADKAEMKQRGDAFYKPRPGRSDN